MISSGLVETGFDCFQLYMHFVTLPDPLKVWYGIPNVYELGNVSYRIADHFSTPDRVRHRYYVGPLFATPFQAFAWNFPDNFVVQWSCLQNYPKFDDWIQDIINEIEAGLIVKALISI